WSSSGTSATELGNLGTDSNYGSTDSEAYSVNDAGAAVGYAVRYNGGAYVGSRAVLWFSDATAIDLNSLIDPSRGWTLTRAYSISDTNWVSGEGNFDPDGAGPMGASPRGFLLDVSAVVPEPPSFLLLGLG